MRRIIDLLSILALCAAFILSAGCSGDADPDPTPDPEPEVIEDRTTDLDFCVYSELDSDVLELIYSRFTGKRVACEAAKVVFISGKDIDSEEIWKAYERGAAVVVVSPTHDLLSALSRRNIGFMSAETVAGSLFLAFHRSGKVFSMDDYPPKNLNGLISWVGDVSSANTSGEDLLQAFHLYSSYAYNFDKTLDSNKKGTLKLTGNGTFDQYYSIIPLYAFRSEKSTYVGDFYLVDATFSVSSKDMYSGVKEDFKWGKNAGDLVGFFLTGYKVEISLEGSGGAAVTSRFNQVPSPSTTINSTTYTSGMSWSFDSGLSGGPLGAGLSLNTGCSYSSTKTRVVRDLSIIDNSDANGNVSYKLEIKNLPQDKVTAPPAISSSTFDFHCGWAWSVANTTESDTTTRYRMKVTLSEMNYRDLIGGSNGKGKVTVQDWPITSQVFYIDLPVPNRIPYGNVKLVNSEKGKFMTEIAFTNASDSTKVYKDQSGSVYSYQQCYETSLPEGTYKVRYKLGGTAYTGSGITIKRAETRELQSGYYAK